MLRGRITACRAHMATAFSSIASLSSDHLAATNETSGADSAAFRFMSSSLRWCDAMASCSLRTAPCLPSESSDMCDDKKTWQDVLASGILEIANLDAWKHQAAGRGMLGPVELVKRAATIEAGLSRVSGQFGRRADTHVSAALVYLHVVVSGANPRIPDLYNHVYTTIQLLRSLVEKQESALEAEVRTLMWPICMAGCLAEGADRAFITSLLNSNGAHKEQTSSLERTRNVLAECWRLADSGEVADPDWTSAMSSLNQELILF